MEEIGSRVGRILVEPIERDFGRKSSRSAWSSMRGRRAIGRAKGPPGAPAFPSEPRPYRESRLEA